MRYIRRLRDYDEYEHSMRSAVETGEESIVQQKYRDEVDINTIVRRFGVSGAPARPDLVAAAMFGDFTDVVDVETAYERIERVEREFNRLDPLVRERFRNDPAQFVAHVQGRMALGASEDEVRQDLLRPVAPGAVETSTTSPGAGGAPVDAPASPA